MSRITMTSELRKILITEMSQDISEIIVDSSFEIVTAENNENYKLCSKLHLDLLNYLHDTAKIQKDILNFDPEKGLIEQYQNTIHLIRVKMTEI